MSDDRMIFRAAEQTEDDPSEYVLSDETVDRMGDVITASGWDLADFRRNPIALLNHDKNQVIGRWEKVRVIGKQLIGRLVLADEGTSAEVDKARKLVAGGFLRAVSVGFRPIKSEPLTEDADKYFGPFRYLKQMLLEVSVVAVPANPNALQVGRSYPLTVEVTRSLFGEPASGQPPRPSPPSRVAASRTSVQGTRPMSTLTKRIEALQKELTGFRDHLDALSKLDDPSEDEIAAIDELTNTTIPAAKASLERLERMEKTLGFSAAEPADDNQRQAEPVRQALNGEVIPPAARPFSIGRKKVEPADLVFRCVAAGVRAFGLQQALVPTAKQMYGNDEAFEAVLRAAVNPATTTTAGWAAELVNTANAAFLDRLVADSIYGPLSGMGARYDLGRNGSLKIPTRSSTPRAAGAWVGEGAPKPVKRIGLGQVTLTPHKLAVITTFTEEIAMSSIPAIEDLLRQAMADDTSEALDGFLIDNVAGSATRPAGLLNGVTPITASAAATDTAKMVADLKALVSAIVAQGGGRDIAILINPAQAMSIGFAQTSTGDFVFDTVDQAGQKFRARFIVSRTVPAGTLVAVDAAEFATATGDAPRFAVSNEATLHEEDTTPLALGTVGSPNTVAAPMRSLFQTDSVAIRLSLFVTWVMRRAGMVQTIAGVTW